MSAFVMVLAAAADGSAAGGVVIFLLLWAAVGGGVGALIGKSKGLGGTGFALGLFLGFIGWIIVAVMEPSQEERTRRQHETAIGLVAAGNVISQAQHTSFQPPTPAAGAAEPSGRPCPWCAELIKPAAIVCRFCGREVEQWTPPPPPPPKQQITVPITDDRWLADPLGGDFERLWNGSNWTEHIRSEPGGYRSLADGRLADLSAPTELRDV
jgi:hypothetical protein